MKFFIIQSLRHSFIGFLLLTHLSCTKNPQADLVIYSYDSLLAESGWGSKVIREFQKSCSCTVRGISSGDAGQILSRLSAQQEPRADLILGIDQHIIEQARPWIEPWNDWRPLRWKEIPDDLKPADSFLPFDFGVMTFMADMKHLERLRLPPPRSFKDLLKKEYRHRFILEDPRTSTPGLGFLLASIQSESNDPWAYWSALKNQWRSLSAGWDQAYALFLKEEAPLVWSYTTSEAYHRKHNNESERGRYKALTWNDPLPLQIEGAAITKQASRNDKTLKLARAFLDFILSSEAQTWLYETQWMFPVFPSMPKPDFYKDLPEPRQKISKPERNMDAVLKTWRTVIQIP